MTAKDADDRNAPDKDLVVLGWREWVGLPELAIPRIKAKIDTGARTSALHAFRLADFEKDGVPWVRFCLHPLQYDSEQEVVCELPVIDRRVVTDSGGHQEVRHVVKTPLRVGRAEWPIEITLTARDDMRFRMLLGRTAMHGRVIIDPSKSYLTRRRLKRDPQRETSKKPSTAVDAQER